MKVRRNGKSWVRSLFQLLCSKTMTYWAGRLVNEPQYQFWGCIGGMRQLEAAAVTEPGKLKCCWNSGCIRHCILCMQQSYGFTALLEANEVSTNLLVRWYIRLYNELENPFLLSWYWRHITCDIWMGIIIIFLREIPTLSISAVIDRFTTAVD
jgi:hypothetical protein